MPNRRDFLSALAPLAAAGLSAPIARLRNRAPRVEASTSVFYAHPAAETTLVRFSVLDADAPAGRMRVYDGGGRRILGTAGVLGVGGTLFGELWLPLRSETRIVSQLEMPGLDRPLRTEHIVIPQTRWTLYWITIVDPEQTARYLRSLPSWRKAAALAMLNALMVTGNPFPASGVPIETLDHLPLLRTAIPARMLEDEMGIPASPMAFALTGDFEMRSSLLGLTGAGVAFAALGNSRSPGPTSTVLRARDGSTVSGISISRRSTPAELGFAAGRDVMARETERWLNLRRDPTAPSNATNLALLVGTDVDQELPRMAHAVTDWNSRYAFPRIVVGNARAFLDANPTGVFAAAQPSPRASTLRAVPAWEEINRVYGQREVERVDRAEQMLTPLNQVLATGDTGLDGIARSVGALSDGTLVFNSSPVPRTDIVVMPDGSEQLVTDVPAIGYTYLPTRTSNAPRPHPQPGPKSAFGQLLTVRLDPDTGAVSSLYHRTDEREWVRAGSPGLNAVRGAVLQSLTRLRLPNIGMRLIAKRTTELGSLTTTVTAYESQPWIDIENELTGDPSGAVQFDFYFDLEDPRVVWETPSGFEESSAPVGPVAHLRWMQLVSRENWQVLFRGLDAPYAAVDVTGRIVSLAPPARTRYRLKIASPFAPPDEPWHFGWSTDPFVTTLVQAGSEPNRALPRYGHLIAIDQPGVAILGIKPADNGDGAIVYLQELLGAARDVKLSAGILGFREVRQVDLLERHQHPLPTTSEPAVTIGLPAHGVVALRLLDLYVHRG